jgi:sulfite oxidase
VTPVDAFYVRNHGDVPEAHPAAFRLRVEGLVDHPLELSLDDLRDGRFAEREVLATLQCAGNRRAGLIAVRDIPGEAPWGPGATGTAQWRGVALADVLAAAAPRPEATDVAFVGADTAPDAEPPQRFAGSIPRRKAERHEVLLAWAMNGKPLSAVHGAPLRVVVPGWIGARSVKWLQRVELRATPCDGYFQATAYRLLAPDAEPAPGAGVELGEVAVNSDVLVPDDGAQVPAGRVDVRGYAFAGGERSVVRVDVSHDGGRSWTGADLLEDLGRWAWRLWRVELELGPGEHEIVARAWDSAAGTQPEHASTVWNPKGYVNSAWSRVRVVATG